MAPVGYVLLGLVTLLGVFALTVVLARLNGAETEGRR